MCGTSGPRRTGRGTWVPPGCGASGGRRVTWPRRSPVDTAPFRAPGPSYRTRCPLARISNHPPSGGQRRRQGRMRTVRRRLLNLLTALSLVLSLAAVVVTMITFARYDFVMLAEYNMSPEATRITVWNWWSGAGMVQVTRTFREFGGETDTTPGVVWDWKDARATYLMGAPPAGRWAGFEFRREGPSALSSFVSF